MMEESQVTHVLHSWKDFMPVLQESRVRKPYHMKDSQYTMYNLIAYHINEAETRSISKRCCRKRDMWSM